MEQMRERIKGIIDRCEDSDAIFICDKQGYVAYCHTLLNHLFDADGVVGKHILAIFPDMSRDHSSVMRSLSTGETMLNDVAETVTYQGDKLLSLTTVIPIRVGGEVVGAVDSTKFYLSSRIWMGDSEQMTSAVMEGIVGNSQALVSLREKIRILADGNGPVLLYGEPGAGKTLVAYTLYRTGTRAEAPFLQQSCANLPPAILECVLFGTEEGCYPGAVQRPGLLERAAGGILYLSQIDELSHALQLKLLKVLRLGRVRRMGGTQDISVRVRIICSLNSNPLSSMIENKLTEPLYQALSSSKIAIPPLRDHREDVIPMARLYIQGFNKENSREVEALSPLAEGLLQSYGWPGNVRELYSTLESALHSVSGNCILVEDLKEILSPEEGAQAFQADRQNLQSGFSLSAAMEAYERKLIRQALSQTDTVAEAARLLGLSRQLLQYKMQKFDL